MQYKGKHIDPYESFYWNVTERFNRGQLGGGISRTVKTDGSLAVMVEINNNRCIQVGNIYPDSENMANRSGGRVNSTTGCAPTILSRDFKQPKMIMEEVKIAAMRGRNPDNPSERGKSNGNYQQRLEVNENGTSNTITSVQKDNLVVIPLNTDIDGCSRTIKAQYYKNGRAKFARQDGLGATGVMQIGNIVDDTNIGFKNPQRGRVNSADGLSPCLNCCEGGGLEPKIIITDNGNNETKGIYTESNETNTRKILQILREEVGEETYQWTIGRLVSIFKAEILQQGVYEEGICKDGETLSRIQPCTSHLAENSLFDTGEGNEVRDMRKGDRPHILHGIHL